MKTHACLEKAILASTMVLGLIGCGGSSSNEPLASPIEPTLATPLTDSQLQAMLDDIATSTATVPGIALRIESPNRQFIGASGVSNVATLETLQVEDRMPAGSAGKPMIAVMIMQMVEQGRLSLDDTLTNLLPPDLTSRLPNADSISVRHLLGHTSGIVSYLDIPQAVQDLTNTPDISRADIDVISYIFDQPADSMPGTRFSPSNSDYLLLGLILDELLGERHIAAFRQRVIEPAFMDQTFYLGAENNRGEFISGYRDLADLGLAEASSIEDVSLWFMNLSLADAPIATTVEDLARFSRSFASDNLLLTEQSIEAILGDESLTFVSNSGVYLPNATLYFGLGLFIEEEPTITLFHHGGDQFGWLTHNVFWEERDMIISVMLNCGGDVCEQVSTDLVRTVLDSI
jgi:D-alanyl-D-alanine carboxypeptidase